MPKQLATAGCRLVAKETRRLNVITILCDTLRRDHCGPYHHGQTVAQVTGDGQPDWVVPTPNIDRLAARGAVFDQAWCGSHPCMPARRDFYTGRFEFPWRGWGPLEDDDLDLPRQVSGVPNHSLSRPDIRVSQLITDHFHLWEQGSGNYHMGYSGFDFVRGVEADAYRTDPVDFPLPAERYRLAKVERHFRNAALTRRDANGALDEDQWFAAQTFQRAATWLDRNHTWENFYLHIDSFPPHELWDPPERFVKHFDPRGYDVPEYFPAAPYAPIEQSGLTPDQVRHTQALYAASVMHVDECLGKLLDALDRHDLWRNTLVIFTTDHGTYNGARGRLGKLQTHLFDPIAHIPLIVAHPTLGHGERRDQLVQLVDLYPTTLAAVGADIPADRHGINLLPVLADATTPTRDYAIAGIFGQSVTITDGRWVLHQPPVAGNAPLFWYSHRHPKFLWYDVGPYECTGPDTGRRPVRHTPYPADLWLSDQSSDPAELTNVAAANPAQVQRMQTALSATFDQLGAPAEQRLRLGLPQPDTRTFPAASAEARDQ
jgi:arylsulfatase A-like enzyme